MPFHNFRLSRLEAQQQKVDPHVLSHFIPVVRVPHSCIDQGAWLAQVPCRCGMVGCPARQIGLVVPSPCEPAASWQACVEAFMRSREDAS
jgi:hypothetical protein